jgi:hypothetical protein
MRVCVLSGLFLVCVSFSSATVGRGDAAQETDIAMSGTEFMRVCSPAGGGAGNDPQRLLSDATCQGWVEGFADGFTVHDELLGVPRADRMVCIPRNVTNVQIIRAIGKYINGNPDKAHRATRLVASLALAQAFPCKRSK